MSKQTATWRQVRQAADVLGQWASYEAPGLWILAEDYGSPVRALVDATLAAVPYADVYGPDPDPNLYRKALAAECRLRNGELPDGWSQRG